MSRLTHSFAGFRRSMQLSSAILFAFVEGKSDRSFYSQFCDRVGFNTTIPYVVVLSQELTGTSRGKQALVEFFEYLDSSGSLFQNLQGKKSLAVFYLDKDVDDLTARIRNSQYIVYTEYYELENYLFIHGDIARAAAIAAELDLVTIRAVIGEYEPWRRRCAVLWKEWVVLCAYAQVHRLRSVVNYGVHSFINPGIAGPVDSNLLAQYQEIVFQVSGLSNDDFNISMKTLAAEVEALYRAGNYDRVFKGKWYALFILDAVRIAAHGRAYNLTALKEKLYATMAATLNFDQPWTGYFIRKLEELVEKHGLYSVPWIHRLMRGLVRFFGTRTLPLI